MNKTSIVIFLFMAVIASQTTAQKKSNFLDGYIVSLKGGYHTEDNENSFDHIPDGFSADGTLEFHTGKNWYIGVNADLSFGNDTYLNEKRSIVVFTYTPIVRYRFFIRNADINIGAGLGASSVTIDGIKTNDMLNLNLRAGIDFMLSKKFLISFETVYNEMMEVSEENGRTNRMAMIKLGLGYYIGSGK